MICAAANRPAACTRRAVEAERARDPARERYRPVDRPTEASIRA